MNKTEPRVLIGDIETYNLKANLSPVICFAWRWYGEKKVDCRGLWDFPTYKKRPRDDKELLQFIHGLFLKADAFVAHFGSGFDYKFIKSRLIKNGLPPLPPVRMIDTWKISKDHMLLTGNRLKGIAEFLGVKNLKGDSGGWETWMKVMDRDPAAIRQMVKYNKQDVNCLYDVFEKFRPFIRNLPSHTLTGSTAARKCPSCGSGKVQKQGVHVLVSGILQRFQCQDCGSWHSEKIAKSGIRQSTKLIGNL